jgi:hypothetical protein
MMKLRNEFAGKRSIVVAGAVSLAAFVSIAYAATFGPQVSVSNVKVKNIWSGRYGPNYITFEPATLTGCHNLAGGYLSSTWADGMADLPNEPDLSNRQLSLLLFAKATDASVSIYYRVNSSGSGWDKCTIDSIWIE